MLAGVVCSPSFSFAATPISGSPLISYPSLVHYYPLQVSSADAIGSLNGTDISISYTSPSIFGSSASQFNGSASTIVVGNAGYGGGSYTITAWIYPTSNSTNQYVWDNNNNDWQFQLYNNGSGSTLYPCFGSGPVCGSGAVSLNTWHQVAIRLDSVAGTANLFLDGAPVATTTYATPSTPNLHFGSYAGIGAFYGGALEDVGIFTQALSDSDISNLYGSFPPSGGNPAVNFVFPTNGTSTPQFTPWVFGVTGLTSTNTYQILVQWKQTDHLSLADSGSVSSIYNAFFPNQGVAQIFQDPSGQFTGAATGTVDDQRPQRNLNYISDGNTIDSWTATAYLMNLTLGGIAATSTIDFNMYRYAGSYSGVGTTAQGTTTVNNPSVNASGTLIITQSTSSFGTILSLNASTTCGGDVLGLCYIVNGLFTPSQNYQQALLNGMNQVQNDFPFSFVYGTIGTIKNSAENLDNTTSTLSLPLWGTQITVVSSSSLSDFVGPSNKNLIFNTEDAAAWVGVSFTALKLIF